MSVDSRLLLRKLQFTTLEDIIDFSLVKLRCELKLGEETNSLIGASIAKNGESVQVPTITSSYLFFKLSSI